MAAVANVAINLDSRGVPAKLKQIADRGKEVDRSLNGAATASTKAANNINKTGNSAVGAAAKLKSFGAALNSALGPIGLALSGLAGLSAAFQTLQQQDFAEAKVRSLGTNSEQLVTQLKSLSTELKGQASVTELTAAAYDVASAGFVNAADAVNVLKAASLGAVGGFSDINTVGNAATSVLNAYEMSAANATSVVDKFIQTQNDGKIVVAEYAQNIGKVASAAAGLGIPLEEINAVIAQATASGVQAEVAFTGLKGALARLASGEASKALKDVGIDISAASLESDGLLGTLQKLQGLDTGQIFKALGTEAGPALLPVLNNLERYEELINRQKDSTGAAARAQAEAANTIQGALKRLQTAFQNAFADQSSLGKALKSILLGAAVTVEALASAFDLIIAPIEAVSAATGAFGKAIADVLGIDSQQQIQDFEQGWQSIRSGIETVSNVIVGFGQATGQLLADLTITAFQFGQDLIAAFENPINTITGFWEEFSRFVVDAWNGAATSVNTTASNLWSSISGGVRGIIGSIGQAFADAFTEAFKQIKAFYNQLPGWLRGALQGAANVGSAVTGAVQSALGKVGTALGEAGETLNRAFTPPAVDQGGSGPTRPFQVGDTIDESTVAGGKVGGASTKAAKDAQRAADEAKRIQDRIKGLQQDVALNEKLRQIRGKIAEADLAGDQALAIKLQGEERLLGLVDRYDRLKAKAANNAEREALEAKLQSEALLVQQNVLTDLNKLDSDKAKALEDQLRPLQEQRRLLEAQLNGRRKEEELIIKIENAIKGLAPAEAQRVEELIRGNAALQQRAEEMASLKQLAGSISDTLEGGVVAGLSAAVETLVTGADDLDDKLKNIAQGVLADIGQQLIKFGVSTLFQSIGGGGAGGIFANLFRANGGPVNANEPYIVGERGPELFIPFQRGQVMSNEDSEDIMEAAFQRGGSSNVSNSYGGGSNSNVNNSYGGGSSNVNNRYGGSSSVNNSFQQMQMVNLPFTRTAEQASMIAAEREAAQALRDPGPIDVRYESTVINNTEYVTAEQHRKGLAQAAERGRALTLQALQNSPKTRRKVGV